LKLEHGLAALLIVRLEKAMVHVVAGHESGCKLGRVLTAFNSAYLGSVIMVGTEAVTIIVEGYWAV
jgi:hypothetical protein